MHQYMAPLTLSRRAIEKKNDQNCNGNSYCHFVINGMKISNYTEAKKFDEIINTGCMHWLPYDTFLCSQ